MTAVKASHSITTRPKARVALVPAISKRNKQDFSQATKKNPASDNATSNARLVAKIGIRWFAFGIIAIGCFSYGYNSVPSTYHVAQIDQIKNKKAHVALYKSDSFIPKNKPYTIYTKKGFDHVEIIRTSKTDYLVNFYLGKELVDKQTLK